MQHEDSRHRPCFQVWWLFFLWSLVRFKCARNSRVDHLSRLQGCDLTAEALWALSRNLHDLWMHQISPTSSPLVPYLMRARSGLGPSRAEVLVGCVRRFCPPPFLWLVFGPSFVRFFFSLAVSGFACFGLGVLVLVFSLFPFLLCVPPLVFWLSNCHLIFMVISFPFSFNFHLHLICRPRLPGVCVKHLNRWKTSNLICSRG